MKHLLQFNRFMVMLIAMLTLSLTSAWGATHTGTFKKITSAADLTTGYYVVTASSSSTNYAYALGSTVNSNKRAEGVSVTITSGAITNPATTIVYLITKSDDGYSFKNESTGTYLYQASNTSGKGMGFNSSVKYLTLAGYNSSSPKGFKFTLNGASNNFFKWNNSSKWFANYANEYSTSQAPVELFKLASQTTITLDKNVNGTADGAVTYTVGNATPDATPEPAWVSSASSDYTLEGYYTAAEGGVKVINANKTLNTDAADYVDANGNWKYATTSTLTLYAQWQSSSDPQITITGTLEPFTYVAGQGPSEEQTIVLKGSNLTENVEVTAPEGYECRLEDETEYSSTLSLNADAVMEEDGVSIYVHLTEGLMAGTFNGKLTASSEGADDAEIAFQGSVTPAPLTSIAAFIEAAPTTARELTLNAASNVVIIGKTSVNLYVQDAAGSTIVLYNSSAAPNWAVGKRIEGTLAGTYSVYNSLHQMTLTAYNEASADNDGAMPTPVVLTEFTADNFAANKGKLIKIEDVFFQSTSISSNQVIAKNANDKSFVIYNTFGTMSSKTLPLKEDAADATGVYIAYNTTYELAVTAIDAGDAKIDVDPVGGADEASAVGIAPGGSVTITPISGFTTKVDDVTKTAITTVPVTEPTSITIAASRDFYTDKSVTYFYKVNESIKAVNVTQPEVGGTIAADPTSAAAGTSVELSYEAASHYTFGAFTVMAGETPVSVDENEGVYSFTMPNSDVTVTATFNLMAQDTAFFVGGEGATGTPDTIARYKDELTFQLPANQFTKAGFKFAGWSDGAAVKQPGENYTLDGNKIFTATWNELSKWATTYTSNVTGIGTSSKVKIGGVDYNANKQNKGASTKVTIPAGSTELHFHALAWKGEAQTITVAGSLPFAIVADDGVSGSGSTYTLTVDPSQVAYFSIPLTNITKDSVITFQAANNKRFVLFGVNAVQPAELTIDPAEYDFGSVKENASANKVFTITPNAFVEGDLTASFEGTDAAKFSAEVNGNNVTVTFTPAAQGAMEATLKVSATNANVTADLSGTGIAAATPEIVVPAEPVNFGKIKQDATAADQQITVTLNNLDAATASISGSTFTIDKTTLVSGANTITISANTSAMGEKEETITITGAGAEEKQITVKIDVLSKWADVYTSNVGDDVLTDEVVIGGENYDAIKKGTGTASQSAVISVPKGTQTLHFHAAAWNNEATVLVVKQGDTQLGSFSLYKDAGVKSSSPYTLQGNNYSTEQYFHVSVAAYTATDAADITFTTTASPYRFVLYGVNQEGGIVPVLDRIEIGGTATKTEYEVGDTFDPAGLTVSAIYKLEGVDQPAEVVTDDVEWSFVPASLELTTTTVTATATYETKQASKDVAVTVSEPVPAITVEPATISFGTVEQGAELDAKTISVTIKNITSASVTLAGEGASAFEIDVTELTASGSVTVTPNTALAVATYEATITIADNDSEEKKVVNVSMTLEPGDICDQDDDFNTVVAVSSYGSRTTTDGWKAENTRVDVKDTYTYFSMMGKTSAVGIITSPVFHHGISALKFRYGNIAASETAYSIRIDIKQGEEVVKTYSLTKTVTYNEIYTETISDINVAGDYQIVFTNLCPSGKSDKNIDRAAIGRICITEYADYARTVTPGNYGTLCLPNAVAAADMVGFEAFKIAYKDADVKNLIIESVESLEAGHAYIILPSEATITCMFSGEPVTATVAENGLYGTFTRIEAAEFAGMTHDDPYMLKDNKIRPCQGAAIAGANKAWIEMGEVCYEQSAAPQRVGSRRVTLGTADSQTTTGLNTFGETKLGEPIKVLYNGQIIILRDGQMFNAQGQILK